MPISSLRWDMLSWLLFMVFLSHWRQFPVSYFNYTMAAAFPVSFNPLFANHTTCSLLYGLSCLQHHQIIKLANIYNTVLLWYQCEQTGCFGNAELLKFSLLHATGGS
jgi:hypothetical protein